MSKDTKIQWTDYTWSPWLGCRKVSPGCENCYITTTPPFRTRHIEHGSRRERTSESYWKQAVAWNLKAQREGMTPRVFPSLCDPFDQEVPIAWKIDFWKLVWSTPNLTWLILTKRPERFEHDWGDMIRERVIAMGSGLPRNVWLGVSAEDQKRADERIPILLSIPAKVRFLSVEPMLGMVKLDPFFAALPSRLPWGLIGGRTPNALGSVDWVIFGGESGQSARPCNVDWIRDGVRQCKAAEVPAFVKQLGSKPIAQERLLCEWEMKHPKGGDPSEWPEDLRVREFPIIQ